MVRSTVSGCQDDETNGLTGGDQEHCNGAWASHLDGFLEVDGADEGGVVFTDPDATSLTWWAEADDLTGLRGVAVAAEGEEPFVDGLAVGRPATGELIDGVVAGFVSAVGAEDLDADLGGG